MVFEERGPVGMPWHSYEADCSEACWFEWSMRAGDSFVVDPDFELAVDGQQLQNQAELLPLQRSQISAAVVAEAEAGAFGSREWGEAHAHRPL